MTPTYWTRIGLGALAVFAVGMAIVGMGRRGTEWAHEMAHSASTISIPLVFVPFKLDGTNIGSIRRLEVLRDAPDVVTGARLEVKLRDNASAPVQDCALAVDDFDGIGEGASFFCADDAAITLDALVPFGTVTFEPSGISRQLLLPQEVVQELYDEIKADPDFDTRVSRVVQREVEMRNRASELSATAADLQAVEDQLTMHATAEGISLKIVSALEQAGVLLNADSNGAALSIYNHPEGDGLLMKADSHGFVMSVKEAGQSRVQMKAGPDGLQLQVKDADSSAKAASATDQ